MTWIRNFNAELHAKKKQCNSGNTILRRLHHSPYLDNWSPLSQTDIETDLERICLFLQEPVTTLSGFLFTLVDLLGHTRWSNLSRHDELHYFWYRRRKRMKMKSIVPTNLPCDVIGRDDLHEYSGCNSIAMKGLLRCCCDRQPKGEAEPKMMMMRIQLKSTRTEKDINIQRVADCMPARFWEGGKPNFHSPTQYYVYYIYIICIMSSNRSIWPVLSVIGTTQNVSFRTCARTACRDVFVTREVPDFLHTAVGDSALTRCNEYENANNFSSTLRQWHRLHHRSEKRSFRSLSISFCKKQDILKNIDHGRTQ